MKKIEIIFDYEELETIKNALNLYDLKIDQELETTRSLKLSAESLNISSLIHRIEKELKKGK